jgi:hypothetical protein
VMIKDDEMNLEVVGVPKTIGIAVEKFLWA